MRHELNIWKEEMRIELARNLSPKNAPLLDDIVVEFHGAIEDLASHQQQTGVVLSGIRGEVETTAMRLVEDVTARLKELSGEVDRKLKASDDRVRMQLVAVTTSLDQLRQAAASLRDLIERTQDDVYTLDRRLCRIQTPEMKAEIDGWAVGKAELGTRVRDGQQAARRLRDTNEQALHARIAEHEKKVAAHKRHQHRAVEAARLMATLDPASRRAWVEPMRTWTKNHAAAVKLAEELPASAADARDTKAKLERIAGRHSELRPVVERGAEAAAELRQNVQDYLKEVVGADKSFPTWFVQVLGIAMPRRNWQAWLHTAIGVICYRIVYGVSDEVYALGTAPDDEEQRAEYDQLIGECAPWRTDRSAPDSL
jgi:chromosome segregation ATPase